MKYILPLLLCLTFSIHSPASSITWNTLSLTDYQKSLINYSVFGPKCSDEELASKAIRARIVKGWLEDLIDSHPMLSELKGKPVKILAKDHRLVRVDEDSIECEASILLIGKDSLERYQTSIFYNIKKSEMGLESF